MPATRNATKRNVSSNDNTKVEEKVHKLTYAGRAPRDFSLPESHGISIKALHDAIPAHCFQRSVVTSFSYVVHDLALAAALWYFAYNVLDGGSFSGTDSWMIKNGVPLIARWVVWGIFQFVLGCVLTGVWVIAHDQVFVPPTRSEVGLPPSKEQPVASEVLKYYDGDKDFLSVPAEDDGVLGGSPLGRLIGVLLMWIIGWPAYIIYNAAGQNYGRNDTHVAHHLFSTMPHYHAAEATEHIKKILEPVGQYTYDTTPVVVSVWNIFGRCRFVEDEGDILFWKR
ncbi:hypothetical protein HDU93_007608 [Gonapodya sp. JEL0774]|nr:hypothetical protein HDU93_007608 [Gonapodya sp. JEL0774]